MDHQADDPLGDPLERDLEALLAVEPSPEFLARVRTRIAEEPAPSSWQWSLGRRQLGEGGWRFALAGAAAAVVLAAVIMSWTARVPSTALPQQAVVREDVGLAAERSLVQPKPGTPEDVGEPAREGRLQAARPDARSGRRQGRRDESPFAEVLVSEDERRAFALLLTRIEEGRLPPVPPAADQTASIEPPAIDIPDLIIEPLPQIAALE
jgi:hypothetical protein